MTTEEDQSLQDAVHCYSDAWAAGDWQALDDLTSASYTHVDFGGEMHDRDSWLEYVRRRQGQPTRIEFEQLDLRKLGEIAIVNGIHAIHWKGDAGDDGLDQRIRFTQVWRQVEGSWKREAFQATLLPP